MRLFLPGCCLIATLLVMPTANAATNTSFSYLQVGFASVSFDDSIYIPQPYSYGSVRYDAVAGANVAGGWQFHEHLFLFMDANAASNEGYSTSLELAESRFGLGGAVAINDIVDFVGKIAVASSSVEACSFYCATVEGSGSAISAGIRAQVTSEFELNAAYERYSLDYETDGWSLGSEKGSLLRLGLLGGGLGHGFMLEGTRYEDASLVKVGYRYTF